MENATNLIEDTEEIIYATSARMLLAGVIKYLQRNFLKVWTIKDMIHYATLGREELSEILSPYAPEAAAIIKQESKLSQNILTNLYSSISPLVDLAEAWENTEQIFSVHDIMHSKVPVTFIMQGSGLYKQMANAIIKSIISAVSAEIEEMVDSKERRIWFFLDEFPQLGKIDEIVTMLEIGRSKGACVVLASQNIDQLSHIYGEDVANSIQAMCGTHIIGKMSVGAGAEKISENLGEKEVIMKYPVINNVGIATGYSMSKETVKSVPSYYLTSQIGPEKDGIKLLVYKGEGNFHEIKIGYTSTTKLRKRNVYQLWADRNSNI